MNKKRILYIDDCAIEQELAVIALQKQGYDADCCDTLNAAQEKMKKNTYDIVYIDWNLKQHTGIEVAEILRKNFPKSHYYIISSFLTDAMIEKAEEKGFYDCYEKDIQNLYFDKSLALA